MARHPRFVIPGQPQHVIQRGNNRSVILNQWGQTRSIYYNSPTYQKEGSDYGTPTPFCYNYREK